MPRMNKKRPGWLVMNLRKLPKPVALFIIGRVLSPLALMVASLLMAVFFALFMALVFVVAPFAPKPAHDLFKGILEVMGK